MTSSLRALEEFLHAEVPLVRAMQVKIVRYDREGVVLQAPLDVNKNHRGSAFAGSLATLVTLSGWALTHLTLRDMGLKGEAAVSRSHIDYLKPVTVPVIQAFCPRPAQDVMEKFRHMLQRRGVARWELSAQIRTGDELAVAFIGTYAVSKSGSEPQFRSPADSPRISRG